MQNKKIHYANNRPDYTKLVYAEVATTALKVDCNKSWQPSSSCRLNVHCHCHCWMTTSKLLSSKKLKCRPQRIDDLLSSDHDELKIDWPFVPHYNKWLHHSLYPAKACYQANMRQISWMALTNFQCNIRKVSKENVSISDAKIEIAGLAILSNKWAKQI